MTDRQQKETRFPASVQEPPGKRVKAVSKIEVGKNRVDR